MIEMSECLNLYLIKDAHSAEYCHAGLWFDTVAVVKTLFSGFKCELAECLCLVYNCYYTCVFRTLTVRSCCVFGRVGPEL